MFDHFVLLGIMMPMYVNEGDNFYLKKVILGTVLQNHTLML